MTPTQLREAIEQLEREGWKVVPNIPTYKMVQCFWGDITHGAPELKAANEAYTEMLAAAPAYSGGE